MKSQIVTSPSNKPNMYRLPYSIDSRTIEPGDVYICLPKGERFISEAYKKGAIGTMIMTRKQSALWANLIYQHPSRSLTVIGVTGTNGKTSVCHFLGQALESLGHNPYVLGTLNAALTTPESLTIAELMAQHLASGGTHFVMEVSSHAIAQDRVVGIDFDITLLTNITQDHLDYHGTFEAYKQTKLSFLNDYGKQKIYPSSFQHATLPFSSHLKGDFLHRNLMMAYQVLLQLGIEKQAAVSALQSVTSPPGRFEIVPTPYGTVIVDYAHTPDGLENVLKSAKPMASNGHLHVVVGCGGDRDRTKRPKMAEISVRLSDSSWFTQDNPRTEDPVQIMEDMMAGVPHLKRDNVTIIYDRFDAIKQALMALKKDDVLVIAGKGHETYQILNDKTIDFDDKDVVKRVFHEYIH